MSQMTQNRKTWAISIHHDRKSFLAGDPERAGERYPVWVASCSTGSGSSYCPSYGTPSTGHRRVNVQGRPKNTWRQTVETGMRGLGQRCGGPLLLPCVKGSEWETPSWSLIYTIKVLYVKAFKRETYISTIPSPQIMTSAQMILMCVTWMQFVAILKARTRASANRDT